MPTGYTDKIKNGISFKEFAMGCARAFGACITMRDDSSNKKIPEEFKPSLYYKKLKDDAVLKLISLKYMNIEEADKSAFLEYEKKKSDNEKYDKGKVDLKEKYDSMLLKAKKWVSPSEDHNGFKNFMISQIEDSIKFDCTIYKSDKVKKLTGEEWLKLHISKAEGNIVYYDKEHIKELEKTNKRNLWIKQLRNSMKNEQ